jgi:hypothetical protein
MAKVVAASPQIPARRGPSVGGDGEPAVNKEEVTHDATSNKRGSMEEARGRGGVLGRLQHRGTEEKGGERCSSLTRRKGEERGVSGRGTRPRGARGGDQALAWAAQQGAAARGSDREETDRWATGGGRGLKLMSRPGCI